MTRPPYASGHCLGALGVLSLDGFPLALGLPAAALAPTLAISVASHAHLPPATHPTAALTVIFVCGWCSVRLLGIPLAMVVRIPATLDTPSTLLSRVASLSKASTGSSMCTSVHGICRVARSVTLCEAPCPPPPSCLERRLRSLVGRTSAAPGAAYSPHRPILIPVSARSAAA